jgi:hypothetical protein
MRRQTHTIMRIAIGASLSDEDKAEKERQL